MSGHKGHLSDNGDPGNVSKICGCMCPDCWDGKHCICFDCKCGTNIKKG